MRIVFKQCYINWLLVYINRVHYVYPSYIPYVYLYRIYARFGYGVCCRFVKEIGGYCDPIEHSYKLQERYFRKLIWIQREFHRMANDIVNEQIISSKCIIATLYRNGPRCWWALETLRHSTMVSNMVVR